jgi:hypothetical protein
LVLAEAVRGLVIAGGGGVTLIVSVAVPVPLALVALMVTELLPGVVTVPLINPVPVLMLKPAGSPDAP